MFKSLLNAVLGNDQAAPQEEVDHRVAMAALLVRCARVDDHYDVTEIAVIDSLLAEMNGLSEADATEMRRRAEDLESTAGDTVHLTKIVKKGVPFESRYDLIKALWKLVLADEERASEENAFLRLVSNLLGVNDRDSGLARQEVLNKK